MRGLLRERIETTFAERDAVARALGAMQDGDLLVVLAGDMSAALAMARRRAGAGVNV